MQQPVQKHASESEGFSWEGQRGALREEPPPTAPQALAGVDAGMQAGLSCIPPKRAQQKRDALPGH
jgi:hypothetical protein